MQVIVVINPKGGSGKSTFATNLAGGLAQQGRAVMLGDIDRQQSSRQWLQLRPPHLPPILSWDTSSDGPAKPPKQASHIVLDTPAGLHGKALDRVLKHATHVIVPVQPSMFDILATRSFLEALREEKALRKGRIQLGVIGMRVDARTRAANDLARFIADYELPLLTYLRSTQLYVHTSASGITLFDLPASRVERDLAEWQPVLRWLREAR